MSRPNLPRTLPRSLSTLGKRTKALEAYPQSARFQIKVIPDRNFVTAGDDAFIFLVPDDLDGLSLIEANAYVTTVGATATVVQLRNVIPGVDMLTTPITIEAGDRNSYDSGAPPVINDAAAVVAGGDHIAIDIDSAGSGARGLGVVVTFGVPHTVF